MVLLVCSKNSAARRLYDRLGYRSILEDPWALRAVQKDGDIERIRVTNLLYARTLEARQPEKPKTQVGGASSQRS